MPKRPVKPSLHKHSRVLSGIEFNASETVHGFSVRYNQPFYENDLFKIHFRSDFFTVLLIIKGELTASLNLEAFSGKQNSMVIIPPNAIKKVEAVSNDTLISGVNFTTEFLLAIGMPKSAVELLDYFSSNYSAHWKLSKKDTSTVQSLMKQLNDRVSSTSEQMFGKELLYHTFHIFLYEVYNLSKKYAVPYNPHVSRKEDFTRLVQAQFKEQRNVQAYANQLHITAKYLSETVKEITGQTAGEIIDNFVLLEAKLMLDNPALSIAEIADELHFSDQSFFGKYFKRLTNLSPKQYRQSF